MKIGNYLMTDRRQAPARAPNSSFSRTITTQRDIRSLLSLFYVRGVTKEQCFMDFRRDFTNNVSHFILYASTLKCLLITARSAEVCRMIFFLCFGLRRVEMTCGGFSGKS